jgi:uncharacterized protein YggE
MDEPANERARSKPTATVRGVGIAPVHPDGARVVFTVRHRAAASDEALGEAARKSQALEDLFVELGIDQ